MNTKQKVLALLEAARGDYLSGVVLAQEAQVSRSAVWKAVGELKREGYEITAVTNRGYCLSVQTDIISLEGLLPYLPPRADWAQRIRIAAEVVSTNQIAKDMANAGAPHGTILIADRQTAGKGRYDRSFFSPPGGLYVSFILRPAQMGFAPTLTTVFAAAQVCRTVEEITGKEPRIKWVNDVYLDGKKIGGILTEAVTDFESRSFQWVVLGIGLNFRIPPEDFPRDIRDKAGSIYRPGEGDVTRNQMLAALIGSILQTPPDNADILAEYRARLLGLGQMITVRGSAEKYQAVMLGVDDNGHLLVRRENGAEERISSGEIAL